MATLRKYRMTAKHQKDKMNWSSCSVKDKAHKRKRRQLRKQGNRTSRMHK